MIHAGGRKTGTAFQHGRSQTSPLVGGPSIAVADLTRHPLSRRTLAPASCEVEPHRDAAHVVPIGEFDIAVAPTVDARISELRDAGFGRLVLDLRQVTFIDVCALRVILKWTDAARADGRAAFEVIPGPPHVQRIFTLTGTANRMAFVSAKAARRRLLRRRT
jgi:anti-anti-sigma factor